MPLTNCKIELKLKRTKYCVLSAAGNGNVINDNDNANNVIFTVKDTKPYVPLVTFSAIDNQKLSQLVSKGFERSVYWNEYKTKRESKNKTNEYRCILESNFDGVNRLFVLVYSNKDDDPKRFKTKRYYLPKNIMKNFNVTINGKELLWPSNWIWYKTYEEIRNLTTGKDEDYTTGCFLDYGYIKNHFRLIAVDLSRQKKLDAYPKAIQQIEFVEQLEKLGVMPMLQMQVMINLCLSYQNLCLVKIFSRKCNSIINNGKLSRSESWTNKYTIRQIKISRLLNKKSFEEELPHELFLTRKQTTKMWNPFANICQQIKNLVKLKFLK